MIKLLWNTQNQDIPNPDKKNLKEIVEYNWGIYHQKNSNKWIFDILKKVNFKIINSENDLENNDVLIIVDSSVEKKFELYNKLKIICSKTYLIHLGDETGINNLNKIYDCFNFVWRSFCLNRFFNNKKVSCLPIGYKSGVQFYENKENKKYKWSFIGTPHRSSRQDILFQFSEIQPSFCHKTNRFNEKIINTDQMSKILSATDFIPCPNGFFHPETYRIYEALECECIPIVENAFKYYDRLFPNNPFIKVDKWMDAKSIVKKWNEERVLQKKNECKLWWKNYKNQLKEELFTKINS